MSTRPWTIEVKYAPKVVEISNDVFDTVFIANRNEALALLQELGESFRILGWLDEEKPFDEQEE